MDIKPKKINKYHSLLKRNIDIVLSIFSMILLLPLFLALALIVGLNSTGGIIYKQIRLGKNGKSFNLYKFRTMHINSEINTGPIWADKNDSRITREGKILRKFHLDEIPQLYNVFKGHMSIVGPRPERPHIVNILKKEIPSYTHRMRVKPGITGWAQIMGGYDATMADVNLKLKHDIFYIENMSIFMDLKIMFMTILAVIKGKGQ